MSSFPGSPSPPTALAKRFIQYVLGFGVAVGVGLAPFLGRARVPGFTAVLELYPITLQHLLIPIGALLMGVIALVVQFTAHSSPSKRRLRLYFRRSLISFAIFTSALLFLYALLVVKVTSTRLAHPQRFAIGFTRHSDCDCLRMSNEECIERLSFDTAAIRSCWGDIQVDAAELLLSLAYLGTVGSFAVMVGLLLLHERSLTLRE